MSVALRLSRAGRRHSPFYHIAAFDSRTRRDGKPVEAIGFYDPSDKEAGIRIDLERAKYWLGEGAKPSSTIATILKKQGLSSSLWVRSRKKAGKAKVDTTAKKTAAKGARSVKKRKKARTANSKLRAEKKKS